MVIYGKSKNGENNSRICSFKKKKSWICRMYELTKKTLIFHKSGDWCTPPCGNPLLYTSYMIFFIHYIGGNFVQLRKMRCNSVTYTDKSFLSSSLCLLSHWHLLTATSHRPPTIVSENPKTVTTSEEPITHANLRSRPHASLLFRSQHSTNNTTFSPVTMLDLTTSATILTPSSFLSFLSTTLHHTISTTLRQLP